MATTRGLERHRETVRAYRRIFNSPEGQLILRDMMKASGFTRTNYVPGSFDATAHNEGQRAMVLRCAKMAHIDEAKLIELLLQQQSDSVHERE